MKEKPTIAIVGAGNLGTALALSLRRAGYRIPVIGSRPNPASRKAAALLAKQVGARVVSNPSQIEADVVWICVPDSEIARVAGRLAQSAIATSWNGRVALHSSGALTSDELASLRIVGAALASVHPMMTFVKRSLPSLAGVPFALEGDPAAVRIARRIIGDMGGQAYPIRKKDKAAYHAWGTFVSPLFTALLATSERVAAQAGVKRPGASMRVIPILMQTLANYTQFGAAGGFSGPIVRGDTETVKQHLRVLSEIPAARQVYIALAKAAMEHLPVKHREQLQGVLDLAVE